MNTKWELLEKRGDYYLWRYEDAQGRYIYNATKDEQPPKNEAGYYSFGYLLKVKGLMNGLTVNSIIQECIQKESK